MIQINLFHQLVSFTYTLSFSINKVMSEDSVQDFNCSVRNILLY